MHSAVRPRALSEGRTSVGGWLCRSGSCHTTWQWSEGPFLGGRFVSWPRLANSGTMSGSEHSYVEKARDWPERRQKGNLAGTRGEACQWPSLVSRAVTGQPITGKGVTLIAFSFCPFLPLPGCPYGQLGKDNLMLKKLIAFAKWT